MSEIEIDHKPKIFDDPEYCNSDYVNKCHFLDLKENNCTLHLIFDEVYGEIENGLENYFDGKNNPACKCPECKTAYQKALKEKEVKRCPQCDTACDIDTLVMCPVCEIVFPLKEELRGKVKNPCSTCGREWDCVETDSCSHCGNVAPF